MPQPSAAASSLSTLVQAEQDRFRATHPRSAALAQRAARVFPGGVPLHWMADWSTPFPLYLHEATGARITDADGLSYADFCLGDTGAMFGHAPPALAEALAEQAGRGLTAMLPSEDAVVAAEMLSRRFGLPYWQMTNTASDANRAIIRWARQITGRPDILVFNGCYHGAVEDAFVRLGPDGRSTVARPGLVGQVADHTAHSRVVEFNDLEALERALADRRVALVLAEPALTNLSMVLPEPGFHDALRRLTRDAGTLLAIDETHTLSTGPGGWTARFGLEPDFLTLGKPIAGGVPCAVYGFTAPVAQGMRDRRGAVEAHGHSGMGTTLSANALAARGLRVMLERVMTADAFAGMEATAQVLESLIAGTIANLNLPWHVTRIGARTEFHFSPRPFRCGGEAARLLRPDLEQAMNLLLINRGVLIAPFHNMMLTCPATGPAELQAFSAAFAEAAALLAPFAPPASHTGGRPQAWAPGAVPPGKDQHKKNHKGSSDLSKAP